MDIDTAANFLVGSILFGLGFCIIAIGMVVINNVFHKYWKPVKFFLPGPFQVYSEDRPAPRFATEEEMKHIAPTLNPEKPLSTKP